MTDLDNRVTIAHVPAGQPLELFAAVCAFFGSAIDGAVIAPGDGQEIAARFLGAEGQDHRAVAAALRAATGEPTAHTEDHDNVPALTLNRVEANDDGTMSIGIGPREVAEQFAAYLLGVFIPAMEDWGAENYLEYEAALNDTGERGVLIFVRPGGKRPSELRAEAEAEAVRLRALLAEHGIDPASAASPTTTRTEKTDA